MSTIKFLYPRVIPVGETAFTVELGDSVDPELNANVHALDALLQITSITGIHETVPTYRSLLVMYDPCRIDPDDLQAHLLHSAEMIVKRTPEERNLTERRLVEIPVQYGSEWGPDLDDVAAHTRLSPQAVIHRHTEPIYQVAMLGFAPGFTYLMGLPRKLSTPRLATPRMHIPPGSVGIAGNQTGLYALDTPGGWRIIGRTTLTLFDPHRECPFMLRAGDHVRFIEAE